MGMKIIWECDGCGAEETGQSAEGIPRDWASVQEKGNGFNKGYICKKCIIDIFINKRLASKENING